MQELEELHKDLEQLGRYISANASLAIELNGYAWFRERMRKAVANAHNRIDAIRGLLEKTEEQKGLEDEEWKELESEFVFLELIFRELDEASHDHPKLREHLMTLEAELHPQQLLARLRELQRRALAAVEQEEAGTRQHLPPTKRTIDRRRFVRGLLGMGAAAAAASLTPPVLKALLQEPGRSSGAQTVPAPPVTPPSASTFDGTRNATIALQVGFYKTYPEAYAALKKIGDVLRKNGLGLMPILALRAAHGITGWSVQVTHPGLTPEEAERLKAPLAAAGLPGCFRTTLSSAEKKTAKTAKARAAPQGFENMVEQLSKEEYQTFFVEFLQERCKFKAGKRLSAQEAKELLGDMYDASVTLGLPKIALVLLGANETGFVNTVGDITYKSRNPKTGKREANRAQGIFQILQFTVPDAAAHLVRRVPSWKGEDLNWGSVLLSPRKQCFLAAAYLDWLNRYFVNRPFFNGGEVNMETLFKTFEQYNAGPNDTSPRYRSETEKNRDLSERMVRAKLAGFQ